MRITLNQSEIEQALRQFVSSQGIDIQGKQVEVSLTAGRGINGFSAELTIQSKDCAADGDEIYCEPEGVASEAPMEPVVVTEPIKDYFYPRPSGSSPGECSGTGSLVAAPENVPAPAPWDAKADSLFDK